MGSIFIGYAREDRERVAPLARALEERGWSVWWDRRIPPGKTFDEVIEEQLDAADAVIGVWSDAGVKSRWVRTEAAEGSARGVLVPILLDDVRIPLAFRRIQAADLGDWTPGIEHQGFMDLVEALELLLAVGNGHDVPGPESSPGVRDDAELPAEPVVADEPATPDDPAARALERARELAARGDWEDVVTVLAVLEEETPDLGETHPEAVELLEDARHRLDAAELYDEAELLYTEGRFQEVVEQLDRVQQLDPDHELSVELRSKAIRHIEERRREALDGDHSRAREAIDAGAWSVAVARLERLLEESPDHPGAQADLARAREGLVADQRYRELEELLRREQWDDVEAGLASLASEHPDFGDPDDLRGRAEAGRLAAASLERSTRAPDATGRREPDECEETAPDEVVEASDDEEIATGQVEQVTAGDQEPPEPEREPGPEPADAAEAGDGERRQPRRLIAAVGGAVAVLAVVVVVIAVIFSGDDGDDDAPEFAAEEPAVDEEPAAEEEATTEEEAAVVDGSGVQVGIAFDVTGRGDRSFNDAAAAGLDRAVEDFGITLAESTPTGEGDRVERVQGLVDDGSDLVIAVGFLFDDAMVDVTAANPEMTFLRVRPRPASLLRQALQRPGGGLLAPSEIKLE